MTGALCGFAPFWASLSLVISGCAGYQFGNASLFPTHIRTVYVPVFRSTSFRPNLGEQLTEAVIKEIEAKTNYKVVGTPNADSVLNGQIVGEGKRVVVENRFDEPRELEVKLRVEISWIDRRRGTVIREIQPVTLPPELLNVGTTAAVVPEFGQSVATGHLRAFQRVAAQIVGMMETPW
jgi:hypothetical protein